MGGNKAPRDPETLSEIWDQDKKTAVFNHSVRDGVFKNIHNSPLKDRMPASLKIYQEKESVNLGASQFTFDARSQNSK
jgi:hypothetical protein